MPDLVGVAIAPVSKKLAVKGTIGNIIEEIVFDNIKVDFICLLNFNSTHCAPSFIRRPLKTWCDETYCDQDCHKTINLNFIFLNKSKKVVEKSLFLVLLKLPKCSFQPQKK